MTDSVLKNPPEAEIITTMVNIHNRELEDNYAWLRDKENPNVIKYLESENNYTETVMQDSIELQDNLYKEILSRIKETDESLPVKIDNYFYYIRTEKGKQYRIYCRKKNNLEAEEEILLDGNILAQNKEYFKLGIYKISPNHNYLAYSVDYSGNEDFILVFKDLVHGSMLPDEIVKTEYTAEWANDSQIIFYIVTEKETKRSYRVYRHTLGTRADQDILIYEEQDQKFSVSLYKTKDKKYIMMLVHSKITTEIYYLDATTPLEKFNLVFPRETSIEYYIGHRSGYFYILTNEKAINFKLMKTEINHIAKKKWTEIVSHNLNIKLEGVDLFEDYLILYKRENGLEKISVKSFASQLEHDIEFPEPAYSVTVRPGFNPNFSTKTLRFLYMSLTTPDSVFDYDLEKKTRELKKQLEILSEYNQEDYASERISAKANDGTDIFISLTYKKTTTKKGQHPLILYGYGSYGISMDPYFDSDRISLIDRGIIYAIAHIRGGGEMGRPWYDNGKFMNKMNTFTDFITCAEHLIQAKYTTPQNLIIMGGSAGGLLVGATVNLRPDLFHGVIAQVPFVDIINTMLDPSLPLTIGEYEEWGNPNEKRYFDYMLTYSPYDNVTAKNYPHMLVTAGLNDPRVNYWEPAKWVAKLRALKTDSNLLLLKTNLSSGHGGASGRYDYLKEIAFFQAFILKILNITF